MAAMAEVNARGLHFNPLQQQLGTRNATTTTTLLGIRKAGVISARCSLINDRWGYRDKSSSHLVFQQRLFSSSMGRSSSTITAPKSTNDPSDPHPRSIFSFSIVDLLVFIVKIPALIFGFIKKEQKYIEKIEDALDDAAEAVGNIAEMVESVAGAVEKVAENVAEDAKETRELMDKVEATAKSMRTDLDTALGSLEEAPAKLNSSGDKDPVPEMKAVAEAASRAAGKLDGVKEAVEKASNAEKQQQQQGEASQSTKEAQKSDLPRTAAGIATNRSADLKYRAVSPSSLDGRSRLIGGILFAFVMVIAARWQFQMTHGGVLKLVTDFVFQSLTS